MERKITRFLKTWKDSPYRKPLILQGARQVGKTYSILEFARTAYENVAYFNFETDPKLSQTFEENISPSYLIPILSHIAGVSIVREKTLIVFDEVQLCERALTSLKYFCEEAPDYHIIVAGSLLGVAVNRAQLSKPCIPWTWRNSYWPLERKRWWSGSNNASRRTAPCLLPCMRRRCSVTGSILWSAGCRSA